MARRDQVDVQRLNAPPQGISDLYHRIVRLDWHTLIGGALLVYLFINIIFGSIYYLLRDGLQPNDLGFLDSCFFSVHTFSTVGYGSVVPKSLSVNLVTVLETFIGLVFMALLTGLFFSKFSRPTAKFIFTDKMLVTNHRGKLALLFRIANSRSNRVMDAQITLTAIYDEITPEGISYRRLEDLTLDRGHTPIFILSFTCAHFIEPGSLSEKLISQLKNGSKVEFLVSIRGLDDTFGQTIHQSSLYSYARIQEGGQFEDFLHIGADGSRTVNFHHFDKIKN